MSKQQSKHKNEALCLGAVLILLTLVGRACVFRPHTTYPGSIFNRGTNAVWLGVEWVCEPHSTEQIASLAQELHDRQIRDIYVYASYLRSDGQFNPTYGYAAEFVQVLKLVQPELRVQAWVGLPLTYVDLGDPLVRAEISQLCVDLVHEGFDGIHLDAEPIYSHDADVLALLDEVRAALGPGPVLSLAARRIWPIFPELQWPLVGYVAWDAEYYRSVAARIDQIAVMSYDSAMPLSCLYRQWMRFQVIGLTRALADSDVDILIGIPTSEEATWTHWPGAENMESGLQGLVRGLNDVAARPDRVTGVAIYPYWDTELAEWASYQSLWLGQQ